MDRSGTWTLSPAYDVVYAHNPRGVWTRDHRMSMAGRRNGFERDDIPEVRNPDRLPPSLTPEKLREAHRFVSGNPCRK